MYGRVLLYGVGVNLKKIANQSALLKGAALIAITGALTADPAAAQNDAAPLQGSSEAEMIVVTGSRIARSELDVAHPIVMISARALAQTGQSNVTDALIRNPALTASIGASLSGGANVSMGGTGINVLNLRNLGPQRTLVLVNGKRHVAGVPDSAIVDINSIPLDLIERVDVLTGGTSAIYGADGVSGVVNFVMKRNFDGLTGRAQTGLSSRGDAAERTFSITAGRNFSDGRGNVALAYEYHKSDRLHSSRRPSTGDPAHYYRLVPDQMDYWGVDDPNVFDLYPQNNLTFAFTSPKGVISLPSGTFLGDGSAYDPGVPLGGSGFAIGGTNTPAAGYYGDLQPSLTRQSLNALASYEFSPAVHVYVEGKYSKSKAYSVGQSSYESSTYLWGDNAYLQERFPDEVTDFGAILNRDNFDFGLRGETNDRKTYRAVVGVEGALSDHVRYDLSYVYGRTTARYTQTSALIADRFFAALDAVSDPLTGDIVCRSTLMPGAPIDPINFGRMATTFATGANSPCRPLNLLGDGVADQAALDFILADNVSRSQISQQVWGGYISGDTGGFLTLPGGPAGFALGAEYRREKSRNNPDPLLVNGEIRGVSPLPASGGQFNVKEVFAELNLPLLAGMPMAEQLNVGGAIRFSDYSTIGSTTTWKFDALYAPVQDIRFRATYSQSVRAPNIRELFQSQTPTYISMQDPCDINNRNKGTAFRAANCEALLAGLGLEPDDIAAFNPQSVDGMNTSRRGLIEGNVDVREETAKSWTVGVVLQPHFIPGLTLNFDWYNIRIRNAINAPQPTELAELCVDQANIDNIYCDSVFRESGTGFFLGAGNDPLERIAFISRADNVAAFRTAGADFGVNYRFAISPESGQFQFNLNGGYLDSIRFLSTPGAQDDEDVLEGYNPRWRGSAALDWSLNKVSLGYSINYWSKTRRFTAETLAGEPDIVDPKYLWYKEKVEHAIRGSVSASDRFQLYAGVNNLFDQKPDFGELSYPVSGVGRFFYAGVRIGV